MSSVRPITNNEVKEMSLQQLALAVFGFCPFCEGMIKNFDVPKSSAVRESMRALGVDPESGHMMDCQRKGDFTL